MDAAPSNDPSGGDASDPSRTAPARGRERRLRWPARALLVLLLALATGEAAVRFAERISHQDWSVNLAARFGEEQEGLFQPHPYIGYVLRPLASGASSSQSYQVNSLGFRGAEFDEAKPPGTFRVACLGGSTTWGSGASGDAATWPAVLERELAALLPADGPWRKVEVVNAGVAGYTLMESFVQLKMSVLPLQPDLVVVYHGINDARVIGRGNFRPDYTHVRRPWSIPVPSRADVLLGWSRAYGLARKRFGTELNLYDVLYISEFETMPQRERAELGLQNYDRTLRELIAIARVSGAEVLLTTFAYTTDRPIQKGWMLEYGLRLVDQINAATLALAHEQGIAIADIAGRLGAARPLFVDPVHLSDEGNGVIGRFLANQIAQAGLLSPRAGASPLPDAR